MIESFFLTEDEAKALQEYFYRRAGYISHEFDLKVIFLIRKLDAYISRLEKEKIGRI